MPPNAVRGYALPLVKPHREKKMYARGATRFSYCVISARRVHALGTTSLRRSSPMTSSQCLSLWSGDDLLRNCPSCSTVVRQSYHIAKHVHCEKKEKSQNLRFCKTDALHTNPQAACVRIRTLDLKLLPRFGKVRRIGDSPIPGRAGAASGRIRVRGADPPALSTAERVYPG